MQCFCTSNGMSKRVVGGNRSNMICEKPSFDKELMHTSGGQVSVITKTAK